MEKEIRKNLYRKKAFLLAFFCVFLNLCAGIKNNSSSSQSTTYELNSDYDVDDDKLFAKYKDFDIYFLDEKDKDLLSEENNICIIDGRDNKLNPSFKVCDSYRITSSEDILNIVSVIMKYEEEYPSRWSRTVDGLCIEWYLHNVCYELNILVDRSMHVDLDHKDAFIFESDIMKLIFRK